jgi:transposase
MPKTESVAKKGRKSKLDNDRREKLLKAIRVGNDKKVACALAGISEATLYRWLEQSKKKNSTPELREFRESLERAEAEAEVLKVSRIAQAADNGRWQAAAWWLERKYPERWGQQTKIKAEVSGPDGQPIAISVEEARRAVLEILSEGETDGLILEGASPEITGVEEAELVEQSDSGDSG